MTIPDFQYENLLEHILNMGTNKSDRTGTGTKSVFGAQLRYDLSEGFPLITTKKVNFRSVVAELLWFLSGDTNIKALTDQGVHIWDEWADEHGNLGPVYGAQWRAWDDRDEFGGKYYDQISQVVETLKTDPDSRRMIVSAWNVGQLSEMALAPCHVMFQFYVAEGKLSCQLYQRSADMFLGVPFNIASYALLTHLIALEVGLEVGEFIWTGGDCHIYNNHYEQVELQLSRFAYPFPTLVVDKKPLFDYVTPDISVSGYNHHPYISAPVAV